MRTVRRFFSCGKGYATERQAWVAAAKAELKPVIRRIAQEIEGFPSCSHCDGTGIGYHCHSPNSCPCCEGTGLQWPDKESTFKAYEQMFPHDPDMECGRSLGGKCTENGCYEDYGDGYISRSVWVPDDFKFSWCKTAYLAWIEAKIVELKNQPKLEGLEVAA